MHWKNKKSRYALEPQLSLCLARVFGGPVQGNPHRHQDRIQKPCIYATQAISDKKKIINSLYCIYFVKPSQQAFLYMKVILMGKQSLIGKGEREERKGNSLLCCYD